MTNYRQFVEFQDLSDEEKPWVTLQYPKSIHTREGIKSVVDTFDITISDQNMPNNRKINTNDNIHISLGSVTTPSSVDFDGIVSDISLKETIDTRTWKIKGTNRFEYLFGYQRPTAFTATTAFSAVSGLIAQTNDANIGGNPDWVPIGWDSNNDVTTKTINFYRQYKPVHEHIEELSSDDYTGAGQFIYYIDKNNNFIWKARPTTSSATLEEGVDFFKDDAKKTKFDIVNAAIIHGGNDFNGAPVFRFVINARSVGKLGFKWKYFQDIKLAEILKAQQGAGPTKTLPFGDETLYSGGNAQLRTDLDEAIKSKWKPIIDKLGVPRWKVTIDIRGTTEHVLGDIYTIKSNTLGWSDGKKLRLVERSQFFDINGWKTSLVFEDDEDTAISDL